MDRFHKWLIFTESLAQKQLAYHGGEFFDGDFTLNHIGRGEGWHGGGAIGPGIYLSDCPDIARLYTKYAKSGKAAVHEVMLDTDKIYDLRNGTPAINPALEKIKSELGPFKGMFGELHPFEGVLRKFGTKAAEVFAKYGIDGAFTRLPGGCKEIVVFNPSIIHRLNIKRYNADMTEA